MAITQIVPVAGFIEPHFCRNRPIESELTQMPLADVSGSITNTVERFGDFRDRGSWMRRYSFP